MDFHHSCMLIPTPKALDKVTNSVRSAWAFRIRLAGAAGNLVLFGDERRDILLADLELAVSAHKVQRIVLLGHQACGKYGSCGHTFTEPTAEEAFHADTLKKAQMLLKEKFPSVEVLLGFTAVADDDTVVIRKVS